MCSTKKILATILALACCASAYAIIPTPREATLTKGSLRTRDLQAAVQFVQDPTIPSDGYDITICRRSVSVRCSDNGGRLYAMQTLEKLSRTDSHGRAVIPCGHIYDYPRTGWRGFMLDSGRQYQSIETIKKELDLLFDLKMNVFHWHLTEGLGWRLEIRKYPRLAAEGGSVGKDREQQGYYTQDQVREIVAYAAERNITVVPEIDMPGHAEAALHTYPEMSCFGEAAEIPESGFTKVIFCAGKDSVMDFLKDILDEVCELFPSEYIHLGGDEAPKGNWDSCPDCQRRIGEEGLSDSHDLQLWFSAQMAEYLKAKGRKAVFWEDVIYDGNVQLPDNVAIQWWNYRKYKDLAPRKAVERGIPVICSPNYYNYINFPETPWMGYRKDRTFTFEDAYLRNPADKALAEGGKLMLGMETTLWTDYVLTEDMLDERIFPRIYALAELMWGGRTLDLESFRKAIGTL